MFKRLVGAALLVLFAVGLAYADVKLKIAVANPSTTEEQVTPVKFDLPKGIDPANIIDIGDMELKYDFDNGVYYVYKKVTLKPSEKKVFEVKLKDIWVIPGAVLESLKKHNDGLMEKLKGSKHSQTGVDLYKKINQGLQGISKRQGEAGLLTKDRINLYYENVQVLNQIKKEMGMLENLVLDIGGIVEERVEVPVTMAMPVSAGEEGLVGETVDLNITVSNPSDKVKELTKVRYALPQEVTPRYIVDNGGLDIEYDFNKECFYLYKDAVDLAPLETKSYTVKIKDIWMIPQVEIDALYSHTNNLMLLLKDTAFFAQAEPVEKKIKTDLENIKKTQGLQAPASEHIAYFRSNTEALSEVKKYVAQLEKLITQSGATSGVTIAKAERLKGGGIEVKREKGYEGVTILAESIFRAKAPTIATTWKIIWIIIIFLALLSATFFLVQLKSHQRSVVDSLTGVFSRAYFLEKLEEELAACRENNKEGFLFLMDIDNFKRINDTYGHEAGDTTLRQFVNALRKASRGLGLLGRIGGDEFLFFFSSIDKQAATAIAEEIRKFIAEEKVALRGEDWNITTTIGIAALSKDALESSSDALIRKADGAMYQGKAKGGNIVVMG